MEKIISGGQTGVDRAALDAARQADMACGGWVPKGREAEDGVIADISPVDECGLGGHEERTRLNVRDSDATLILVLGRSPEDFEDGTPLTVQWADTLSMPYTVVDLGQPTDAQGVVEWLEGSRVQVLNVAGPRESSAPGIYAAALAFMSQVLAVIPPRP
ncbi:MAG: molybdenum cofactor carrier [Alphaproteobacteria bacterium]|nr:molybdenum cofactor carrier [Alphaproteobacteria bacterium]